MRAKAMGVLCGLTALCLLLVVCVPAGAQEAAAASADLQTGPATIATHWSKYKYPDSVAEGATYYIIRRGDTLWDLSAKYLGNPFLWPQIWDQNRYITDAHWIYPGDPLLMPKIALVSEQAGQPGEEGMAEEEAGLGAAQAPGAGAESELYPAIEEMGLQCAPYIVDGGEDTDLYVYGTEQGATKIGLTENDVVYLNKGSNAGIKAGDVFTIHHLSYDVKHPANGHKVGTKVETTGWLRVIVVDENTASAMIERACQDIHIGDYLTPFERVSIPMISRHPAADRTTPPSGKASGYVVDIQDDAMIAGAGHLLSVDLGASNGISPGSILTVFKVMYPSVPSPRSVVGELAVVAVRDTTSTCRVIQSSDAIMNGDQVELR